MIRMPLASFREGIRSDKGEVSSESGIWASGKSKFDLNSVCWRNALTDLRLLLDAHPI